jgi:hypothetical protein
LSRGGRSDKIEINSVSMPKCNYALVIRTSIMYGGLGYMARIADEVALCETTRKQAESEATRGNEIDSEVLTDQCSTDHPSRIINGLARTCLFLRALPSRTASSVPWMRRISTTGGCEG